MAIETNYSSLSRFDNRIRLLGLNNSFFDTTALVEAELQMLEARIVPTENQKAMYEQEKAIWEQFRKDFSSFVDTLQDIRLYDGSSKKLTYTKENVVELDTSASTLNTSYRFTVQQLAKRHQVAGTDIGSTDTALELEDVVQINGKELEITKEMTLRDIVNKINEGNFGVSASIISNRLVLSATSTGEANEIQLTDGNNLAWQSIGLLTEEGTFANEMQKGQDAKYTVNGISLTSSTNEITGVLDGTTIRLVNESAEEVRVEVEENTDALVEQVKKFVDAYNNAIMKINSYTQEGTVLQGQSLPLNMRRELSSIAYYRGPDGGFLFELGIEVDGDAKDGTLRFNETKLREVLKEDPSKVTNMIFGENGVAKYVKDKLDMYTKETGSLKSKIEGLEASIKVMNETIERFDETFEQQRQSILKKYADFETMMARLNSEASYMEAQLKALTGNRD